MSADSYEIYSKIRDKLGYKDSEVAAGSGVTKSTFSDWKKGKSKPKQDKLQKIADYFGVTVDYLMTGKEEIKERAPELTERDERDIAKDLDRIMGQIQKALM